MQAGIVAARRGQRQEARDLFQQVLRVDLQNEQAWLWLSMVVDSMAEKQVCLDRALSINPNNQGARAELEKIAATSVKPERPLQPLAGMQPLRNGSLAAFPLAAAATNTSRPIVQLLPAVREGQPLRPVAADFVLPRPLPPQLLPEEDVPPWVASSGMTSTGLHLEDASLAALALTGCLSITAVSGLLALGVLWLLGW